MTEKDRIRLNLQLFAEDAGEDSEEVADLPDSPETDEGGEDPVEAPGGVNKQAILEALNSLDASDLVKFKTVQNLIEKARQQEKNKVYKSLEAKEKALEDARKEAEKLRLELQNKDKETLSEQELLTAQIQELQRQQEDLRNQMRLSKLEAYKERRLREVGDELILELVGGDSEEEIDASIELAKQKYQEIVEKATAQFKNSASFKSKTVVPPTNPEGSKAKRFSRADLDKMSPDEWRANRSAIMEAAFRGELDL